MKTPARYTTKNAAKIGADALIYRTSSYSCVVACTPHESAHFSLDTGVGMGGDVLSSADMLALINHLCQYGALSLHELSSLTRAVEKAQRFVLAVGAYFEAYPDMPDNLPTCIYDRQEKQIAVTIHAEYAQAICLETTGEDGASAPFTALETWLNNTSNEAFESEGIAPTKPAIKRLEFEGSYQYKARVVSKGRPVLDTEFSDFFTDDKAAVAGFRKIMESQGHTVIEVRIGEITEVEIA